MKTSRVLAITLVCFIVGIMVSWQYKSIKNNALRASYQNKRVSELQDELISVSNTVESLRTRLEELQKENLELEKMKGSTTDINEKITKQLEEARIIAGLTTVKGEGVIVTIDSDGYTSVEDKNILSVLNELRASDVQAMSVNDERIIATSEVRTSGRYIMINGRILLPPYIIKAIADSEKLEHSLKIMNGVVDKLEMYNLKVDVRKETNIIIPKVREDGTVIRIDLLTPAE